MDLYNHLQMRYVIAFLNRIHLTYLTKSKKSKLQMLWEKSDPPTVNQSIEKEIPQSHARAPHREGARETLGDRAVANRPSVAPNRHRGSDQSRGNPVENQAENPEGSQALDECRAATATRT